MKKERLDYFDFAKGIGMICIFIYHLYASTMEINIWVRTFAVQLFFVLSGSLIRYSENNKISFKEHIIKNFKSLMIPYIFFCLLYDFIEGYQYGINDLFGALKGSLLLTPRGALWFLPVLFFSELILYFCYPYRGDY
jgi:fucose 4-O-acetylase-like acetyltransferase